MLGPCEAPLCITTNTTITTYVSSTPELSRIIDRTTRGYALDLLEMLNEGNDTNQQNAMRR